MRQAAKEAQAKGEDLKKITLAVAQDFAEDAWVRYAQSTKPRGPMPWWSLHETSEQDLRAMYRYIRHLGPAGKPAPPFVPSDKDPPPPYETRTRVVK